jgi:predicted phage-related endonuclease
MVNKVTPDTMLSASRLPSVMGISRYRTPNDELEASIRALQGIEVEFDPNEAMEWGNTLEPVILGEAARRLELVDVVTDHPTARFHESLPLCCSLDGTGDGHGQVIRTDPEAGIYVVGQDSIRLDGIGALEAKLTAMEAEDMPPLWRGPIQLQAQMDIIQAKWGAIATLYKGTEMRVFLFAPHQGTVDRIAQVATEFQAKLDKWKATGEVDYYPPADGEHWPEHRGMYPANEETIRLSDGAGVLANKIMQARAAIKQSEAAISEAEKQIKELMGEATRALAGGYTISWPTRSYKAQPAKMVPAKDAYTIRQSTLTIKELKT